MSKNYLEKGRWLWLFLWLVFIYGSYLYFIREKILWGSIGETFFRIFLLFIFLLISVGLGKKILKWLKLETNSFPEFSLFSMGIGLAIFTYLVIGLGLVGLFNKWVINFLVVGMFFLTYNEIGDLIQQTKSKLKNLGDLKLSRIETLLFLILFVQIAFNLFGASVLPSSWDALAVHLARPKEWIRLHRLTSVPYLRFGGGSLPHNIGILYGMSLLVKDAILAKLISFAFGILTAMGVYSLGKRYFSRRVGLFSAAIFYTTPIVSDVSTTAGADLGFTFYAFLAAYALINWITSRRKGWLIVSAILSGLCLGSKYTGFLCVSILSLGILVDSFLFKKERFTAATKNFLVFILLGGAVGSFWYLRTFIISGHSIFPVLHDLLKGWGGKEAFATSGAKEIIGSGLNFAKAYLFLPWNITMHPGVFRGPGAMGLLFLAFLPFVVFPHFRKDRATKFILYYSLIYLIFWSWCMPYKRGLIPIVPLLSIVVACIVTRMLNFNRFTRNVLSTLFILSLIFQTFYLVPEGLSKVYQRMLVFAGLESQEDYILRNEKTYSVFKYINEKLPSNAKVFVMNEPRTFYCDRPYIAVMPPIDDSLLKDNRQLLAKFREAGLTHLVVNEFLKDAYDIRGYTFLLENLKEEDLVVIYDEDPFVVFEIRYT
ncbi:MAG: glycosyltransferase family 39 protein [Candidatus Bathyarchaeota archaeon]|nr:glycosyltransferase family 39 protein [Candidatus Bathyarchaeota archaeon]